MISRQVSVLVLLPAMLFGLGSVASPVHANLFTLGTNQFTSAVIEVDNIELVRNEDQAFNSRSNSNAFDGDLLTPSQARAAGRSGFQEIAANASTIQRMNGPFQNYTSVEGSAAFTIDVGTLFDSPHEVFLEFFLPPGFLEYTTNLEVRDFFSFTATLLADLTICHGAMCRLDESLFRLESALTGSFDVHDVNPFALSTNPTLDLSPLTHTDLTITDTQNGFVRTVNWQYDAFMGTVSLGEFAGGEIFTVRYLLEAEVIGPGAFETSVLAGINDPFFLSTDPLPQQDLFRLSFVPSDVPPVPDVPGVPAPAPALLVVFGVISLAAASRQRRGGTSRAATPRSPHLRSGGREG